MFEVPAGGRRFRGLELLVKQKRTAKTQAVPCVVRTDRVTFARSSVVSSPPGFARPAAHETGLLCLCGVPVSFFLVYHAPLAVFMVASLFPGRPSLRLCDGPMIF